MSSRRVLYNTLFILPAFVLSGGAICYWKNILNVVPISESCSALFLILLFVARLFYVFISNMGGKAKSEDLATMLGSSASSSSTPTPSAGSTTTASVAIAPFDGTGHFLDWLFQFTMAMVAKHGPGVLDVFEIPPAASMRPSDNANVFIALSLTTKLLALKLIKSVAVGRGDLALVALRREFSTVRPEHAPALFQRFLNARLVGTQTAAFAVVVLEYLRDLTAAGLNIPDNLARLIILNNLGHDYDMLAAREMGRIGGGADVPALLEAIAEHARFVEQRGIAAAGDAVSALALPGRPGKPPRQPPRNPPPRPAATGESCAHCGAPGHNVAKCFKKHPELKAAFDAERKARRDAKKQGAPPKPNGRRGQPQPKQLALGAPPAHVNLALAAPPDDAPVFVTFAALCDAPTNAVCFSVVSDVTLTLDDPSHVTVIVGADLPSLAPPASAFVLPVLAVLSAPSPLSTVLDVVDPVWQEDSIRTEVLQPDGSLHVFDGRGEFLYEILQPPAAPLLHTVTTTGHSMSSTAKRFLSRCLSPLLPLPPQIPPTPLPPLPLVRPIYTTQVHNCLLPPLFYL